MRWRIGEGRAVGSFALLATLLTYASRVAERQLWRWSYVDAGIIGAVTLLFLTTLLVLLQPATGPIDGGHRPRGTRIAAQWIDLGWFLWGLGYLIGSAFLPSSRGRLFELDLLNSVVPGASFLEWGGCVALFIALGALLWQGVGRRSWPLAGFLSMLLLAVVAGESWARWRALYRARVTSIPSTTNARWERDFVSRNQAGFRDAEHAPAKDSGSSRVEVVGDEVAFGSGIREPDDRLAESLARRLAAATGHPWEPITLARPGSDTKDHRAFLATGLADAPDAVVLLYSFDDIAYFAPVARPDPLAAPARSWPDRLSPIRLLYVNSVLCQEGYLLGRRRFPQFTGGDPLPLDPYADSAIVAAHLEDIRAFVQSAEERGAATLVVPLDVEVGDDPLRLIRYRRFVAAASAADIPVLAVDSLFIGRPTARFLQDTFDRRPNALVHRAVADLVARRLIPLMGLHALPTPSSTPSP